MLGWQVSFGHRYGRGSTDFQCLPLGVAPPKPRGGLGARRVRPPIRAGNCRRIRARPLGSSFLWGGREWIVWERTKEVKNLGAWHLDTTTFTFLARQDFSTGNINVSLPLLKKILATPLMPKMQLTAMIGSLSWRPESIKHNFRFQLPLPCQFDSTASMPERLNQCSRRPVIFMQNEKSILGGGSVTKPPTYKFLSIIPIN